MAWKFDSGAPIYQQIVQAMRIRIASGAYPPGSRIPPVREIALDAGVNPNTMQRALSELERDGLLYSERTAGRYVTEDEKILRQQREALAEGFIGELFLRLSQLGLSDAQIVEAVTRWESVRDKARKEEPEETE